MQFESNHMFRTNTLRSNLLITLIMCLFQLLVSFVINIQQYSCLVYLCLSCSIVSLVYLFSSRSVLMSVLFIVRVVYCCSNLTDVDGISTCLVSLFVLHFTTNFTLGCSREELFETLVYASLAHRKATDVIELLGSCPSLTFNGLVFVIWFGYKKNKNKYVSSKS